jgi:ABC-type transporter Mla subunit MlaD
MSPTRKAPTKPAQVKTRTDHVRFKENDRVLQRIASSLDVAQRDLGKLRGNLGTGAADLRRNLSRLLRDARRDAAKLSKATRKDLDRLQKDMLAVAKAQPKRAAAKKPRGASASKSRAGKASASKSRSGRKARAGQTRSKSRGR